MIDAPLPRLPDRDGLVPWSRNLVNDLVTKLRALTQVKVSEADAGYGFLNDKLVAGSNVTLTVLNPGSEETLQVNATGFGLGSVTSVAGGVGVTNTPEPIVGIGTVDLDLNSLTTETAVAAGDLFAMVDVSVGTAPSAQRKVTLTDLATAVGTSLALSSTYQPLDADLTEIAAVANVRGDLLVTDSGPTWVRKAPGTSAQVLQMNTLDPNWVSVSGDATIAAGGALTLATVNSNVGSFGSASQVATFTVNGKGLITAASNTSIALDASAITSGQLALARGGTAADLSATGGTGRVLKQTSSGAAITVATVAASEIASGAALSKTDDTNVTLTLGGAPTTALLAATSLTLGWTGTLAISRGGTGAATASANTVFAGPTSGGAAAPAFRALVHDDIDELIALADLTDVTGTTGSGTLVALGTSPSFTTDIRTPLVLGGTGSGDDLGLTATSHSTAGTILLQDGTYSVPGSWGVMAFGPALTLDTNTDFMAAYEVGMKNFVQSTWTVSTALLGSLGLAGGLLFRFNPLLTNPNATAISDLGAWQVLVCQGTIQADGASCTLPIYRSVVHTPKYTVINAGTLAVTEDTAVRCVTRMDSGATVTTRRLGHLVDKSGAGTQTNVVGLDVDDQTIGTLAVGLRSAMSAATGKWHLYCSGTASSYHNGNLLVGTSTDFASGTTHLKVAGGISVAGDNSGVASHNSLTGTSDTSANSTGVGTILFKGATNRNSTGFIKIYVGTTAYYVPFFSAITG